jgi:hypothetical protein
VGAVGPLLAPRLWRAGPSAAAAAAPRIRARGQREQRSPQPAPRGRPEALRPAAAAGSPSARPELPAMRAQPRGPPGSPARPPPPAAPARPRLPRGGRGGHLLRAPGVSGDLRPGCPRAGLLLAPGASSRRPASITAGAPGRKAGPEMRGLLKGQRAFSGLPLWGRGWARTVRVVHRPFGGKQRVTGFLFLFFYGLVLPICKMSFHSSFKIPWGGLQL